MSPRVLTGLDYAPADPPGTRGHTLDLYLPDGDGPRPVLIACGGSAFLDDGGSYYAAELAPRVTEGGLAVAGVGTRSRGQARFPAPPPHVQAAIRGLPAPPGEHGARPGPVAPL